MSSSIPVCPSAGPEPCQYLGFEFGFPGGYGVRALVLQLLP